MENLEQAAQAIATQRRHEAKKLFETTYPDLLPPLHGSRMSYEAVITHRENLQIVFSKSGIPDVSFSILPGGQLGAANNQPLKSEELTSLLAEHIVQQEEAAVRTEHKRKRLKFYRPVVLTLGSLFMSCLLGLLALSFTNSFSSLPTLAICLAGCAVASGALVLITSRFAELEGIDFN